jgi:EpsD family peptidyl-prolyl cis-trans isomerase
MRFVVIMLSLAMVACSGAKDTSATGGKSVPSQVVARVNGTELTVSQLNEALSDSNLATVDSDTTKQGLEDLINNELLVQQAQTAQLDRDPDVLLRIDQARRQILADAFESRSVYPQTPIAEAELHKYYDAHPALFKERHIYRMTAFATDATALPKAVVSQLPSVHSVEALRDLLAKNAVNYSLEELNQGADEVALDLVTPLSTSKVGDVLTTTHGDGKQIALLLVDDIKSAPLPFEQASPTIEGFLDTQRNSAALSAYLMRLRKGARIEYVGNVGGAPPATDADHAAAGLKNLN